jgi:ribonuclease D
VTHVRIVSAREELEELARAFAPLPRIAVDLESDGMFAYRARVCTVQLAAAAAAAAQTRAAEVQVAVVDASAVGLEPLAALLGEGGPVKVVHDVAFDARLLAESGLAIGNVHDTAIAARMLGRTATGLASLAMSELSITIDKGLQHHDWRERPLLPSHVEYLARDVEHLDALATKLWAEVTARGIEAEVLEETRYRIATAIAAAQSADRVSAYGFAKGFDKLGAVERAVFRRLWEVREDEARRADVPSAKLIATDLLAAIARRRPGSPAELAALRLPPRARVASDALLEAIARGAAEGDVPEEDRARFTPPRLSRTEIARRRGRERSLSAWRKAEAARRGVDEQVVLPGHCLKDLAEADGMEVEDVLRTPGLGACRAGYAGAMVEALRRAQAEAGHETG